MTPVTVISPPAMFNAAPPSNIPNTVFQDVLDNSVEFADAQNVDVANAVSVSANGIDSTISQATSPPGEVNNWTASLNMLQPLAQSITAEDATPDLPEDGEVSVPPAELAPMPLISAQTPPPVRVATAVPTATTAPPARTKRTDIAVATAAPIEAQLARPDKLSDGFATLVRRKALTDFSSTVPAPLAEQVRDSPASLDTRFGTGGTISSISTQALPGSPSIAELRQLIVTQDGEWIGALARDIASSAARDNQLQFTLMPENLGQLDVALTLDNGQVDIRLETSTNAAAQIISADQARLMEDLRNAGLKLGQFDMSNRQNRDGQQRGPAPEQPNPETISTPMQPAASSKARGRYA